VTQYIRAMFRKAAAFFPVNFFSERLSSDRLQKPRQEEHLPVTPENFARFTYSKRSHFSLLRPHESQLHHDLHNCDLKMYQDMLAYNFILDNFPRGARLLEIGGGDSRVISWLKDRYEFWNLDKLEGVGNGLTDIPETGGFRLVRDYIGSFSSELPAECFDGVFSVSVLEHVPKDNATMEAICSDIQRVLKPGGLSLHCFDAVVKKDGGWMHPLLDYFQGAFPIKNPLIPVAEIAADPDLWGMSKLGYEQCWQAITKVDYEKFGMPISCNLLWRDDRL